jgi:hypothetical protein
MDRASVFGTEGWGFESLRVHSFFPRRICQARVSGRCPRPAPHPSPSDDLIGFSAALKKGFIWGEGRIVAGAGSGVRRRGNSKSCSLLRLSRFFSARLLAIFLGLSRDECAAAPWGDWGSKKNRVLNIWQRWVLLGNERPRLALLRRRFLFRGIFLKSHMEHNLRSRFGSVLLERPANFWQDQANRPVAIRIRQSVSFVLDSLCSI